MLEDNPKLSDLVVKVLGDSDLKKLLVALYLDFKAAQSERGIDVESGLEPEQLATYISCHMNKYKRLWNIAHPDLCMEILGELQKIPLAELRSQQLVEEMLKKKKARDIYTQYCKETKDAEPPEDLVSDFQHFVNSFHYSELPDFSWDQADQTIRAAQRENEKNPIVRPTVFAVAVLTILTLLVGPPLYSDIAKKFKPTLRNNEPPAMKANDENQKPWQRPRENNGERGRGK